METILIWTTLGISILLNLFNFYQIKKIEKNIEGVAYKEILDGGE